MLHLLIYPNAANKYDLVEMLDNNKLFSVVCSDFSQIFDVDWFISHLARDVKIIKELPLKGGKTWIPYTMRVPRKCSGKCYVNRVLPNLLKKHVSYLSGSLYISFSINIYFID